MSKTIIPFPTCLAETSPASITMPENTLAKWMVLAPQPMYSCPVTPPENILLACLDGNVMALSEAKLPVTDDGLLRGDGVFEVVRLYQGHPYTLGEHLARMRHSGEALRLDVDVLAFRADIEKLLTCDPKRDGALRLIRSEEHTS